MDQEDAQNLNNNNQQDLQGQVDEEHININQNQPENVNQAPQEIPQPQNEAVVAYIEALKQPIDSITHQKPFDILKEAIETKNTSKVEEILQNFLIHEDLFDIDESFSHNNSSLTMIDLAWQKKYFEIVKLLLEANSKFPANFNTNFTDFGLKTFVNNMQKIHDFIKTKNITKITEIIKQYPKLKYFYNTSNESATLKAIKLEKFEIFDFLKSTKITIGHHENAYEALTRKQKKIIKFSEIIFQGHSAKLFQVVGDHFEIFSNFSPSQIVKLLKKEKLEIGQEIQADYKNLFRNFCKGTRLISGLYDITNFDKVYILADDPKSGRTTAVKQLAWRVKQSYSNYWVTYIDLKTQWNESFQTFEDIKKLLCKDKFEEALFMQKYSSDTMAMKIFWDGLDEMDESAIEKIMFMDISISITEHSSVQQWFVTQPDHDKDLLAANRNIFKLKGFNTEQSLNYLWTKFDDKFESNREISTFLGLDVDSIVNDNKVYRYLESLATIGVFDNDLSLHTLNFIAEFSLAQNFDIKFSRLIEFCEEILKNIDHKPLHSIALKKFVNIDKLDLYVTDVGTHISSLEVANINTEKCEKFKDFFETFLIAEWIFKNAYLIEDNPSEDETAVRVNLLLVIATKEKNDEMMKILTKLLMEFIDRENRIQKGFSKIKKPSQPHRKLYSPSYYNLPEFKYALLDLLYHDNSKNCSYVENFCEFFKHDQETLNFLFRLDENETFINYYRKEFPTCKTDDLMRLVRKYFKDDEIEKMKIGKLQIGSQLFNYWFNKKRNFKDVEDEQEFKKEEKVDEEIFNVGEIFGEEVQEIVNETAEISLESLNNDKISETSKFQKLRLEKSLNIFELLDYLKNFITTQEMSEIFLRNSNNIFSLEILTLEDFRKVFELIEATTKPDDIVEMLKPHRAKFYIIFTNALKAKDSKFLEAYFEKFEKYLSEKIIRNQLEKKNEDFQTSLMLAIWAKSKKIFDVYWNFLLKYLKGENLKKFLLELDNLDNAAIHQAAIKDDEKFFKFFLDFHLDLFKPEELREIFTEGNEFLHRMILNSNLSNCKAVATLVEVLWADDKQKLQDFLIHNDENIFMTFKNQEVYRDKLKPFVKLLKSTFDVENEEEMNQFSGFITWNEEFENNFNEE